MSIQSAGKKGTARLVYYQKKIFNICGGAMSNRDCLHLKIRINKITASDKLMKDSKKQNKTKK